MTALVLKRVTLTAEVGSIVKIDERQLAVLGDSVKRVSEPTAETSDVTPKKTTRKKKASE